MSNFGLVGDRHAGRPGRQISILNAETLAELTARGIPAEPGVTSGDRPVCQEMLEVHLDALKAMADRAGKMAWVERGGTIRPGDRVELIGKYSPCAESI